MIKNYGTNKVVVGAHFGLKDWLIQAIGTVVIAVAMLYVLLATIFTTGALTYASWTAIFQPTPIKFIFSAFIVIIAYHFWVTLRDVWMDYVKILSVKLVLFIFTACWLVSCAVWLLILLWRI